MNSYKSPYRRGADDGLWFGLCLSLIFIGSVLSQSYDIFGPITLGLMISVPVLVYMALRRTFVAENGATGLSALWMQGIMMFLCGALLAGAVSVVYLKWINPHYISDLVTAAIEAYRSVGDESMDKLADGLQMMVDAGAVPSAPSLVFATIWSTVLSGSILSLIIGLIVRARHSGLKRPVNQ